MKDCSAHGQKKQYCSECLLALNAEHTLLVENLYSRLDAIWEHCSSDDELKSALLKIENQFPINRTVVLSTLPWRPDMHTYFERRQLGPARGEFSETLLDLLNMYAAAKMKEPEAKLGANDKGFFIYREMG